MNATYYKYRVISVMGLLLIVLLSESAIAQKRARGPRKVVEPVNLVYDNEIEGVGVSIQETYIRSSDGLYIPAVVLKSKGEGPFPAVILVHGAPGGRGMSALKREVQTRGMAAERFLNEGYMVVVADYRGQQLQGKEGPEDYSYSADIVSVIRYTKKLPSVDSEKVCLYSGSLGSESSVLALGKESVAAAVVNAPAGFTYMKVSRNDSNKKRIPGEILTDDMIDKEVALANLGKINSPVLFVVGTADNFQGAVKKSHAILTDLGKDSYIDIYPDEKHGFYWGPRKTEGKYEPSPAFSKALEKAVTFCGDRIK